MWQWRRAQVLGLATPSNLLFLTACSCLVTMGLEGVGRRYKVCRPFSTCHYFYYNDTLPVIVTEITFQ